MEACKVKEDLFVEKMLTKWQSLGLHENDSLLSAWRAFYKTLNYHISHDVKDVWSVFPMPTGSGKTEGLKTYCSILGESLPKQGVLIVTRFTDEANKIAKEINDEAKKPISIANHSKLDKVNKPSLKDMLESQVLIITHAEYKKTLLNSHEESKARTDYVNWKHGKRLVVIDETLSLEDPVTIDFDELRIARASIPSYLEKRYIIEVTFIDYLIDKFKSIISTKSTQSYIGSHEWKHNNRKIEGFKSCDLYPLVAELNRINNSRAINSFGNDEIKVSSKYICKLFTDLADITESDCFYSAEGNCFKLQSINLIMPSEIPSAVILDATSKNNTYYTLLGDAIQIVDLPNNIRNYSNVSLNVFYGLKVGKSGIPELSNQDINELFIKYGSGIGVKETLFCTHKQNRDLLTEAIEGLAKLEKANLAHWGDIDGKNSWSHLRSMFILGLPYLGSKNSDNITLSYQRWIESSNYNYHPDLEMICDHTGAIGYNEMPEDYWKEIEKSHINSSVIQAINRINCRVPIDKKGNCNKIDITLFLGAKNGGFREIQNSLLAAISEAMPNIVIKEKTIRGNEFVSDAQDALYNILTSLDKGEYNSKEIAQKALVAGVSETSIKRFQADHAKGDKANMQLSKELIKSGIDYISERGRNANSRYIVH